MQLIKMERLNSLAAPKVITPFMNMRPRSQGILRQVLALLITLSDNTFHITEHVLYQEMWEGHWREQMSEEIGVPVKLSTHFLEQERCSGLGSQSQE